MAKRARLAVLAVTVGMVAGCGNVTEVDGGGRRSSPCRAALDGPRSEDPGPCERSRRYHVAVVFLPSSSQPWFLTYSYNCGLSEGDLSIEVVAADVRCCLIKNVTVARRSGTASPFENYSNRFSLKVLTKCAFVVAATDHGDAVQVIK